ncbi:hypothetical protein KAFR_0C02830 [Kazachstania africana CBS 2517]|uniref:VPS10 domain-containing protein n=1 Tax=Kazachstania africana (strain ATCC 22294 / BCRC 22015 / CBS 2517 / CECT 1963 / NBRC 1671 / NRRL Y-8276) TaxID=1071382 RepID=H2ASC6_KAZAF|nr:hypothetical protein KAFR_0C02830 [Kazachstania africana CBS 2517]CCF57276.1 hypothetical protein KAFR_0C02830 [Kazachstania africana CBS 2517]
MRQLQLRVFLSLLLSLLELVAAFTPKVTKSKSSNSFTIEVFDDSTTLLRLEDANVLITTDNGATWDTVDKIDGKALWLGIDEFHSHDRAIVTVENNKFYITEDQGKSWQLIELDLPENEEGQCFISTHPTNKDYFGVHCSLCAKANESGNRDHQKGNTHEDGKKGHDSENDDKNKEHQKEDTHEDGEKDHFRKRFEDTSLKRRGLNQFAEIGKNLITELGDMFDDLFSSDDETFTCEGIYLVSFDHGKTFTGIATQDDSQSKKSQYTETSCSFIKSGEDLKIPSNDESTLFCKYQKTFFNKKKGDLIEDSTELFTVSNKGKVVKSLEFFNDKTVNHYKILESSVVVVTQDDKFNRNSPKKVWVSRDFINFNQAYIPTQLRYTVSGQISEDSLGRIILPIVRRESDDERSKERFSEILISDSTGLKFETLRWARTGGRTFTHVSKLDFLKGTMISSSFGPTSFERVGDSEHAFSDRITKITVDAGANWQNLKIVDPENKSFFSCDIDDVENCSLQTSRVFDTPTAGILVSIGTVSGTSEVDPNDQQTFISRDGGLTWQLIFKFPTLCETGDMGNVIIAVPFNPDEDGDPESEIYYSLDHGHTWAEYQLQEPIIPFEIVSTTPDGSGVKFILNGFDLANNMLTMTNFIYTIDFTDAFDKKTCGKNDYERWDLAEGKCVNGMKYNYMRRNKDAKCLINAVFEDLKLDEEVCETCTEDDYECAFEFSRNDNGECVPDDRLMSISGLCNNKQGQKIKLKPMVLRTRNKCKKELDISLVEVSCGDRSGSGNGENKILVTENTFEDNIIFYQYFDTSSDESLILGTSSYDFYVSHDGGETNEKIDTNGEQIIEIVFNPFFSETAYFFGSRGTLFVTHDKGHSFFTTKLPDAVQLTLPLDFHAKDKNSFVYYGGEDCESILSPQCHAVAYITRDGGRSFSKLLDNSVHCEFAGSKYQDPYDKNLIICQVKERNSDKRSLVSSTDYFKNDKKILYDNIVGFMTSGDYSIVAVTHGDRELRAYVTQDGDEFAEAKLPRDLAELRQQTFTVLGSETGAIFLHMTTNNEMSQANGDLLKSNSNGTSFVTLQKGVNRDLYGRVDFEKIQGLEGIILINSVDNAENLVDTKQEKKLKTKITFNDGADWTYLTPPSRDWQGNKYKCNSKSLEKCSLNLHGYTERTDIRDTYSSGSALGMMFAVGNVGEYLLPADECSTFLTIDGGNTWKEVKKGSFQWEYGDHGSILVLVPEKQVTDTLSYSLDSGKTWNDFKFTEEKILVKDIITVPQDSAMRFLLIGEATNIAGKLSRTFTIDFSNMFKRQCLLDIDDEFHDDFEYSPLSPDTECLFGHKEEYLKKIHDDCYIGHVPLYQFSRITRNCTCQRSDFECDYNYYKANDGTCRLVEGLTPLPASDVCKKDSDLIEFSEPTGYRKIPLSTCQGGLKLDANTDTKPCPGKEAEFNKKYGISGRSFLLIFFIPFLLFIFILWFIYDRGIRRNGGFSRFGEIRLDDDQLIENNNTDKVINSIVKGGLVAVSAVYSGYQLFKRSTRGLLQKFGGRWSQRRGPSYSSLMHDQFLDEADDLLAGHDEDADNLSSFMDQESNFDIEEDSQAESGTNIEHSPYTDEVHNSAQDDENDETHNSDQNAEDEEILQQVDQDDITEM